MMGTSATDKGTEPNRNDRPALPALDPEAIIYRARGGWVVQVQSDMEPGYWPIEVVTGDTELLDCLWGVLGLSVPASGSEEQNTPCDCGTVDCAKAALQETERE